MKKSENLICDFAVLRDLRKSAGLNIAELSEKSGVSVSVISKLERNCTTAELDTLFRIARVFGLTLSDFLALAENRTAHIVEEDTYNKGGIYFRRASYGNIRIAFASGKKGANLSDARAHGDDYELCYVLNGALKITIGNQEVHILTSGQAIQFDALFKHHYELLEDAELVISHVKKGKRF